MGKESVDCRFGPKRGREEGKRWRGEERRQGRIHNGARFERWARRGEILDCRRVRSLSVRSSAEARSEFHTCSLRFLLSTLNYFLQPAHSTLSRFSHPQCRFLPLSPTCISRCRAAKKCPTRRLLPRFCNLSNPGEPYLTRSNPNPNPNRHLGMNKAEM